MYGFIIKKSFFDDWDNLLTVFVVNLICVFTALVLLFTGAQLSLLFENKSEIAQSLIIVLFIVLTVIMLTVYNVAFGELAAKIANFEGVSLGLFFKKIPESFKDGLLYGLLISGIGIISLYCFDFYFLRMQSLVGFAVGMILFWIDVVVILSLQWFIPIRATMHNNFKKCLKKCLIIFFDNTGFSILVFIHTIIMIPISVFLLGFFPGFAGVLVNKCNALRLRLYKYDYLEEHPELQTKKERKNIPWDELIYNDRETFGVRTLKSLFQPWKMDNE